MLPMGILLAKRLLQAKGQEELKVQGDEDFVSDCIRCGADRNSGFSFHSSLNFRDVTVMASEYRRSGVDCPLGDCRNDHFSRGRRFVALVVPSRCLCRGV